MDFTPLCFTLNGCFESSSCVARKEEEPRTSWKWFETTFSRRDLQVVARLLRFHLADIEVESGCKQCLLLAPPDGLLEERYPCGQLCAQVVDLRSRPSKEIKLN